MVMAKKDEEQVGEGQQDVALSAPAPQIGKPAAAAGGAAPLKDAKGSGMFTNLSQFIEANTGRSGQYGQEVVGGLKGEAGKAKEQLGTEASAAESKIFNTPTLNKPISKMTTEEISGLQGGFTGALKAAQDQNQSFVPEAGTIAKIGEIGKRIGGTSTAGGMQAVTEGYGKSIGEGARGGESSFNTMLLRRDQPAQQQFTDLRKWSGEQGFNPQAGQAAPTMVQAAVDRFEAKQKAAKQAATNLATDFQGQLGAETGGLENEVVDRPEILTSAELPEVQRLTNLLNAQGVSLTPNQMFERGLITGSAFSPDKLARYNALRSLQGKAAVSGPTVDTAAVDRYIAANRPVAAPAPVDMGNEIANELASLDIDLGNVLPYTPSTMNIGI
jgi:hypothetical protein